MTKNIIYLRISIVMICLTDQKKMVKVQSIKKSVSTGYKANRHTRTIIVEALYKSKM